MRLNSKTTEKQNTHSLSPKNSNFKKHEQNLFILQSENFLKKDTSITLSTIPKIYAITQFKLLVK
jgi:hypothetical protein